MLALGVGSKIVIHCSARPRVKGKNSKRVSGGRKTVCVPRIFNKIKK
jgi:hypothetical protein